MLVEEYDQLERSAQETAKPRGLLKLSAPISFGQQLGPTLIDFASAYPDVALEVSFTDRIVNLVEEGFDAAVRISSLEDSSLIARKLANVQGPRLPLRNTWPKEARRAYRRTYVNMKPFSI